ncbi:hypothetical protein Ga0609869_003576 [Rhodovulum iodosum]|uniref:Uncharacterized protein n=1 Tax=Rhodovulum iodosum TaxID=68291 RepID=A0ABV3XYU6_9RHOB|nr:DUF6492 family protein [Rhodovulum robiginosum]RSK38881.1 hypothetical protein EJA01_01655 [Rhodovulum robiginosum]
MSEGETGKLALLTCSMARDVELFALLADSVDACVDAQIRHRVVVPGADIATFRRFGSARREIIAQEDVLPMRVVKLPAALKYLAPLAGTFRRPIYLDRRLKLVRGWILQQLLKIEMARTAREAALLHVDSDVFFFRPLQAADAFTRGRPPFFRIDGVPANPAHQTWIDAAARLLGLPPGTPHARHYVENCVPWSSAVARALTDRIEAVHGQPWHRAVLGEPALSEYYLYGLFVDRLQGEAGLAPTDVSFCSSFWPGQEDAPFSLDDQLATLREGQVALAVQSTHPLSPDDRRRIYRTARTRFEDGN